MITIANANALHIPLPDQSVQCVVTSPPYWGLRDYGTAKWEGGSAECDHSPADTPTRRGIASSTLDGGKETTGHQREGYGTICPRCGARRSDAQIGLESTPAEYVAHIVAVMRECWRVLKDDGTLWLNLGDSYASQPAGNSDATFTAKQASNAGSEVRRKQSTISSGLKPKNLCGIPWRVAFALQQPWYSGRIKNEADRIWLAAMIDTEGCLFIHKRKTGQNNGQGYSRKHDSFGAGMEVANTHYSIVERCQQITGIGSICHQDKESQLKNRNLRLYRWNVRSNECRDIVREVYPYLVAKKHEARLLLGCPSSGENAERAHAGLIALHNGKEADIDFPEPASMYEPGWYLRSDIIWSKLNPMPESVTDRPTKAHEYVFLLAKQARYYYDAEAIKEEQSDNSHGGRGVNENWKAAQLQRIESSTLGKRASEYSESGRNRRSVWTVATQPYSGAHFATFPSALIEPMILAGTSMRGECPHCGKAWVRVVKKTESSWEARKAAGHIGGIGGSIKLQKENGASYDFDNSVGGFGTPSQSTTIGWRPSCSCPPHDPIPQTVLDPFAGSGTTGQVAVKHGRRAVLLDLNTKYIDLQFERTNGVQVTMPL